MDFYNNVAAVASVLMFAKLVTHRNRKAQKHHRQLLLASFHTAAVVAAAGAIATSLIATADGSTDLRSWSTGLLAASAAILVVDVLIDDWRFAKERRSGSASH